MQGLFPVTTVVLRAPADLLAVPAGGKAGASCSSDCKVLGSSQPAADTPLHGPALQPAQAFCKTTNANTSYMVINSLSKKIFLWYCSKFCTLCKGDAPSSSQSVGFARWSRRSLTTSKWPQYADRWSGVAPPGVCGDAHAPLSRRNLHTARWPLRLA